MRATLSLLRRLDGWFVLAVVLLALTGIAFIYSAAYRGGSMPTGSLFQKQMVWAAMGTLCFMVVAMVDYRRWGGWSWAAYAAALGLLVLVLLVGKKQYGAYRWLSVFGFQFQPSEFAKLATLAVQAWFLSRPDRDPTRPSTTLGALGLLAVPFLLIAKEPDLGSALVLIPMTMAMLWAVGVPWRILGVLVLLALASLPLLWFGMGDYQRERVLVFLDPGRDPYGTGWNRLQSAIAVGSGGLHGKGFLHGTQNMLGYLPRTVSPTDFIFSVIAEEKGFVGSTWVMGCYVVLLLGALRAAWSARDAFGRLLAVGVFGLLACHVVVNIAMTIGLLPITGLPLPLLSYGGTFMVGTMVALGLVQSVFIRRIRH